MSTPITFNNVAYSVPAYNDTGYAQGAGNLSSYLIAIASGTFQQSGGTFSLTADANFGTNFGLVALYYKSVSANISTAGVLRLARTDSIGWRNVANNANLLLAVNGSNQLTFDGAVINTGTGFVSSITGTANQVIASSPTGAVTLSLPQSINPAATVTFDTVNATTLLSAGDIETVVGVHVGTPNASDGQLVFSNASTANTITINAVNLPVSSYTLSLPTAQGAANTFLKNNGSGTLSFAPASGNFVSSITGTANQIIASASTGAVTLSTPQDIATTSTPTFGGETISVTGTNSAKITESNGGGSASFGILRETGIDYFVIGSGTSLPATTSSWLTHAVSAASALTFRETSQGISLLGGANGISVNNSLLPGTPGTTNIGASLTPFGNIVTKVGLDFQQTGVGTTAISVVPPAAVTSHTLTLPGTQGAASTFLQNNGSGVLSWVAPTGSGTVNAGTSTHLAYYATSTNAVSDANGATISGTYTWSGGQTWSTSGLFQSTLQVNNALSLTQTTNQLIFGTTNTTTITSVAPAASRVYSIQDAGAAANFVLSEGAATINGVKTFGSSPIVPVATTATQAPQFSQIYYGFQAPIQATTTSATSTTNTAFQTTSLAATITPTSSSHRIKVTVTGVLTADSTSLSLQAYASIDRGGTNLGGTNGFASASALVTSAVVDNDWPCSISYIDSPATTSATTYTVTIRASTSSLTARWLRTTTTGVITLEEIV